MCGFGGSVRQFAARLVALLLRVDVIGRIAIERDLRSDGRITLVVESLRAELGPDPDLRQSVAELDVIARLSTLRAIGLHIAAFRLHQRIGLGTAFTHHSSQRRDRRVIGGVERFGPVFLSDPDPATLAAHLHVPAQRAQRGIVEIEVHSRVPRRAGIAVFCFKHWLSPWTNAWSLSMR